MKRTVIALSTILLACGNPPPVPTLPTDGTVRPGETYSLQALVTSQAGANPVSWSVQEPDGGTIDAQGHYIAPGCAALVASYSPSQLAAAGAITATAHVLASWNGGAITITVNVVESLLSVRVDPTSVTVTPDGAATFRAFLLYTCHEAQGT